MRAVFSFPFLLTSLLLLFLGQAQAQLLTPGAAAIGGTTTDAPLIAPGGQSIGSGVVPTTPTTVVEGSRTVHLPDPTWELTLPPKRGSRGSSAATASVAAAQPTATPAPISPADSSTPSVNEPAAAAPDTAPPAETTTAVTAAATTQAATAPTTAPEVEVVDETTPTATSAFERAALNFGPQSVDLTAEHEIALGPVVALMRANPLEPLRVAAVLALAEASNEDAKLLARRRILAVRRYLIEQGINAENLSFVISANSATEPFANHVLIEQVDG